MRKGRIFKIEIPSLTQNVLSVSQSEVLRQRKPEETPHEGAFNKFWPLTVKFLKFQIRPNCLTLKR